MKCHLKRIVAPKSWTIKRKERTFIIRPSPGPHKIECSMPIAVILRDVLERSKTMKETKVILNKGLVLVDNIVRKEPSFPVGIMDTLSIPSLNEYYRLMYDKKGKLFLHPIKKEESAEKACKIIGKTIMKGKKIQLNLYDGRNLIVPKDEYRVGDSVVLHEGKIKKHLKFEKGAKIYLIAGKYIGSSGILEHVQSFDSNSPDIITLKIENEKIKTRKDCAFVIQ